MISKRFLPIFLSVMIFALLEFFLYKPALIYYILIIVNILFILSSYRLSKNSLIDAKWWNITVLPIIFTSSLIVYSTLLPYKTVKYLLHFLFLLDSVFLFYYFKSAYYYLVLPASDKKGNLENISYYGSFLSFFFTASSVFGIQSFLNSPIWPLTLIILAVFGLLIYQTIWVNFKENMIIKENMNRAFAYILISSLAIVEFAWAIFYLPFNYNILGLLLAVGCYVLAGLIRAHFSGTLDKNTIKLYLGVGAAIVSLVLLTARWI